MRVFISWSGKQGRQVAIILRDWLPKVINAIQPFVSSEDIEKGRRWNAAVAGNLESASIGIICLTRENLERPWVNFEAGALSKVVDESRVIPFLIDLSNSDLSGHPLGQFQSARPTRIDIKELLFAINKVGENPLPPDFLADALNRLWPDLLDALSKVRGCAPGRIPSPIPRHRWGELEDTLVDAALCVNDIRDGYTEILKCLRSFDPDAENQIAPLIPRPPLMPSRYHYLPDAGASRWLERSGDMGAKSHQRRTNLFWRSPRGKSFTDKVLSLAPNEDLDFISLGPGDGIKDAEMVRNWIDAGVDLTYYPYDVSAKLAAVSVNKVRERTNGSGDSGRLKVKLVIADFEDDLDRVRDVFEHRSARNIVALLGNLGNLDQEVDFLSRLRGMMNKEDLLLLEVRLRSEITVEEVAPPVSLRHDFGPLEYYFGMDWDTYKGGVKAKFEEDRSEIDGTRTLVTTYDGPVPGLGRRLATLQYIHFYDPVNFIENMKAIDFDVHYQSQEREFLECLVQPRK